MSDPYIIAATDGRQFQGPTGAPMTVKIDGAATADAYSLIEYSHAADTAGPPPHVHHHHEEAFRVLEGELTLDIDGRTVVLRAGEYAVVPRGAVHRPYNTGAVPVRFFFITSPAMDGFFAELAELNAATGGAPAARDLAALGARWDSEFTSLPTDTGAPVQLTEE
jgi:mannose-6-phosphate isomerase-like protein (cupin superfamily)